MTQAMLGSRGVCEGEFFGGGGIVFKGGATYLEGEFLNTFLYATGE